MILTAPDASSLARSLSRWEFFEYISCALVALACAGEYISEFTNWLTKGIKERKERLAKRSTLLLIASLAFELVCLVRTNTLSGQLIGSLGDKAELADTKARTAISLSSTALSQAKDALDKAGMAQESLGKAEEESNKAQTASSNALTIAGQARKEADSFEADIKSAKKQAGDAESHLAEATNSANTLTAKLERLTTPRRVPHSTRAVAPLKPFRGTEYVFIGTCSDPECFDLVSDIDELLKSAEWKRIKGPVMAIGLEQILIHGDKDFAVNKSLSTGISISVETPIPLESVKALPDDQVPEHLRAAIALNQVLASNVSPPENTSRLVGVDTGPSTAVRIDVGRKPL
jgi:hypothetical protein